MIFVTIGNEQKHRFTRLLRKIDEIAPEISDEIIMQMGFDPYRPKHCKYFSFIPHEEYLDLFKRSKLIISHCSSGPIINATKFNKPIIIFPRRAEFNEHVDNHQIETAKAIEGRKGIHVVYNEAQLKEKIITLIDAGGISQELDGQRDTGIVDTIREFLRHLEMEKKD
jgi:beta-1,4-N-acetylglucosaminyltransferase